MYHDGKQEQQEEKENEERKEKINNPMGEGFPLPFLIPYRVSIVNPSHSSFCIS